ncbi:hypothetical protein, partial [Parasutterella excrementihominis]|uniref:hypothetical protein n=1 Tax=Parasutterella excrementihominis TaxID=487175 RepID=UPI003568D33B
YFRQPLPFLSYLWVGSRKTLEVDVNTFTHPILKKTQYSLTNKKKLRLCDIWTVDIVRERSL